MKKISVAIILLASIVFSQSEQPNGADLQLAINKLSTLGTVLYVGAHPDDENSALLAYFSKEKLYRTAYLSITRGEGGQNLLGPEQGSELGVIRTQELLAARRIDGAEQFFTRAIDFGFSKSSEEALRLWNKDSVLKDVVFVIRKFRPDIIITRFSPTQGGHGQHLASAILAQEAFKISGDPNIYPEQLKYVKPWKATRILFNQFRWGNQNSNTDKVPTLKVDVGIYNSLLGKSYTELAGISRTMHKSQGMGSSQFLGSSVNEFIVTDGAEAKNDLFDGVSTIWNRESNGKRIQKIATEIQKQFTAASPEKSVERLLSLRKELMKMPRDYWVSIKLKEVESLIFSCLGLSASLYADDYSFTYGDSLSMKLMLVNRSTASLFLDSFSFPLLEILSKENDTLSFNQVFQKSYSSLVTNTIPFSQPYWLENPSDNFLYTVSNSEDIGLAEKKTLLMAKIELKVDKEIVSLEIPLQYRWVDRIDGEKERDVVVVPPVSVSIEEKNIICNGSKQSPIDITVIAMRDHVAGEIQLHIPPKWYASEFHKFSFSKIGEETSKKFFVEPDSAASGKFIVEAMVNGIPYYSTVKTIVYPHIPPQTVLEPAKGKLLNIDLQKRGNTIGYIVGAGDEVPKALDQVGYKVSMLTDDDLKSGNLMKYDAIIAGIRSYNTREQLRIFNARLLEYVQNGGTYIVQYQTTTRNETDNIAPYSMNLSRDRVTDENAEMKFLKPDHPLLNYPNKITEKDFEGWIQERGLYFANQWDNKFETILSCADPNENPQEGSLLVAKYGKGYYIFTGLAFFRQLPAGVEGAYRLFTNLISIGK